MLVQFSKLAVDYLVYVILSHKKFYEQTTKLLENKSHIGNDFKDFTNRTTTPVESGKSSMHISKCKITTMPTGYT